MKVFSIDDPAGLVKRFEIGEYKNNLLPLIYTKGENWFNPFIKKESFYLKVQVEKDGVLLDILDIPLEEVFKED